MVTEDHVAEGGFSKKDVAAKVTGEAMQDDFSRRKSQVS